jgi:hypothetical protein
MKNLQKFLVLFLVIAGAVAGNAQTSFQGKFQLTSETRWGKALLPAGHYYLTMDSVQSPIVIHSEDEKVSAMAKAVVGEQAVPGGSYILITGLGNDRQVRSINLPQLGRSLIFSPITQQESETLFTKASQKVPVEIAKK